MNTTSQSGIWFRHRTPSWFSVKKLLFGLVILSLVLHKSDGQEQQVEDDYWCIADEQFTDEELQNAMNWACNNGADCTALQPNQACFVPNTIKDHASYAFNSYYQKMKHKGGSCYFSAAAVLTGLDPSHGSCKFESLP
ncbi:OLC1v1021148C1 [Oldenlandia corymbosa var. corymbosa]|uniref:OLC1v1021148C1 n=1 Tax=Oldenlandia corymbosa var. corymbosa TaxID=529605 RepID=A0AAV1BX88_OLDCO|nr:OLC1v1021148C1 [Oldenlandia corymbosa var. corymbosa]